MRVLTVNGGSSSVKLRLLGDDDEVVDSIDAPFGDGHDDVRRVASTIAGMGRADVVAHRVVHGGTEFTTAAVIDADVLDRLGQLVPLATLHQRNALALIESAGASRPDTPAVACFDTAFHAKMPAAASTYAIPEDWRAALGVRRYGFHGLSHDYASGRAAEVIGARREDLRIVVCHLGSGASTCAVCAGVSIDTSMGFTPLEGLVMATRSGSIDPGAVLWLIEHAGVPPAEVRRRLEHESGILGLAGSADMRAIAARAADGEEQAAMALEVYVHRLRAHVAAMTAAMGGIDVLVFTGGVGENSDAVRRLACRGLEHLGVQLDERANEVAAGDTDISDRIAAARVVVVRAREDLAMARQARAALAAR